MFYPLFSESLPFATSCAAWSQFVVPPSRTPTEAIARFPHVCACGGLAGAMEAAAAFFFATSCCFLPLAHSCFRLFLFWREESQTGSLGWKSGEGRFQWSNCTRNDLLLTLPSGKEEETGKQRNSVWD